MHLPQSYKEAKNEIQRMQKKKGFNTCILCICTLGALVS